MKTEKLKINIAIGTEASCEINTEIDVPLTAKKYWLPTDYKEPIKVMLVDYKNSLSVNNIIRVLAIVDIYSDSCLACKLKEVNPKLLFTKKQEASDYYLAHKKELNWNYLYEED